MGNETLRKKYEEERKTIVNCEYYTWLELRIAQLKDALEEAEDHLEYCGWGDSYERECARNEKLPEKIREALESVS